MEQLIKKFKKVATKDLLKRVQNGKLSQEELQAAKTVLTLRGIPGYENDDQSTEHASETQTEQTSEKQTQETSSNEESSSDAQEQKPKQKRKAITNHNGFSIGQRVEFDPIKAHPFNEKFSGSIVSFFKNKSGNMTAKIKSDDGTITTRVVAEIVAIEVKS